MKISKFKVVVLALSISLIPFEPAQAATKYPSKIISLSPSATEDLFALGAGKQVIAVDDNSNYPSEAPISKLS